MPATKTKPDKLRAAHDKLQDAVAEIVSGDDWQRMLKVASKFHRYNFNNNQMEPGSVGRRTSAATSPGGRPSAEESSSVGLASLAAISDGK
jgi:hypothetical protein